MYRARWVSPPSSDGHWRCPYLLATVNDAAALNVMCRYLSLQAPDAHSFEERDPELELPRHVVIGEEPPHCFPQRLQHVTAPLAPHEAPDLSTYSPAPAAVFGFLGKSHPNAYAVASHCSRSVSTPGSTTGRLGAGLPLPSYRAIYRAIGSEFRTQLTF